MPPKNPTSTRFCSPSAQKRGKMAWSPLHSRRPWAAVAAPSGAGAREMSSRRPVSPLVQLRTRAGHSLCPCPPVQALPPWQHLHARGLMCRPHMRPTGARPPHWSIPSPRTRNGRLPLRLHATHPRCSVPPSFGRIRPRLGGMSTSTWTRSAHRSARSGARSRTVGTAASATPSSSPPRSRSPSWLRMPGEGLSPPLHPLGLLLLGLSRPGGAG